MDAAPPPYVVTADLGGPLYSRIQQVVELARSGRSIRIDGDCASACTLYLIFVSERRLCITPRARLGFHLPYHAETGVRSPKLGAAMMKFYPSGVRNWIRAQGGLRSDTLVMGFKTAQRILPVCRGTATAAAGRITTTAAAGRITTTAAARRGTTTAALRRGNRAENTAAPAAALLYDPAARSHN